MTSLRFERLAGTAGIGFVLILVVANLVLVAAGYPAPSDSPDTAEVTAVFAAEQGALRFASALLPAAWLLATVFAVGVFAVLWCGDRARSGGWALVGLAGILLQCAVFAGVEASRSALAAAAVHAPATVPGLWGLHTALFGFNQVFLATALLGVSIAGHRAGVLGVRPAGTGLLAAALLFASATTSPYGADGANPLALLGLVGWLLWLVWIVVLGVALLRGVGNRASGPQPAPA